MITEKLDYSTFLADLRAKRAALDTLISAYETAQALGALGQPGDASSLSTKNVSIEPMDLPVGAFNGKSLPAAIKLYLSAVKKKQTIRDIAKALQENGVESTSSNFESVVTGALNRLKAAGDVLRFKDGWGLSDHYNEAFRSRLAQNQKPARKEKQPKKKKKVEQAKAGNPVTGLDQQVVTLLRNGGQEVKVIAEKLGVNARAINLSLARLKKKGKVEKQFDKWFVPMTVIQEVAKAG